MLNETKIISGFKYVYLIAFFALLAGFFHPLITDNGFESVVAGVIVLFIGLAGGILIYKSTTEKRNLFYLFGGFALISISLFYVFQLTGRL